MRQVVRLGIALGQGLWVRRTTIRLPPAGGARTGLVGDDGEQPMRLMVVGDSTAAGCGVDTHDDGFAGNLARALSQRSGRSVRWHVHGVPGAVIRDVRRHLLTEVGGDLDLVVLLVGVNDVWPGPRPVYGGTSSPRSWLSSRSGRGASPSRGSRRSNAFRPCRPPWRTTSGNAPSCSTT